MNTLSTLNPGSIWKYFEDICKIPRPSKHEAKISEYLLQFGQQHKLPTFKDKAGNILICKAATPGFENRKTVVLQSHLDMVAEKEHDLEFDFTKESINPFIDNGWVKARGTTLGADNGIGVATQLALLTSQTAVHGPIECLFTVDEETGLTGAKLLENDFFSGDILINLDSEDEGEIFIGCAGGMDTEARLKYKTRKLTKKSVPVEIRITGLKGGHSGDDIHKGRANAIKLMARMVWAFTEKFDALLSLFEGGNMRNAIPREACAIINIHKRKINSFACCFNKLLNDIKNEFAVTEPDLSIVYSFVVKTDTALKFGVQKRFLQSLLGCPNGVISMSAKMPGMVSSSSNLASVRFPGDNTIEIISSQRSEIETVKHVIVNSVASVFSLAKAKIKHSTGYPGWEPNPDNEIVAITANAYKKLFDKTPIVRSIHAGLECGLFLEKYPHLQMVSFGPTIKEVHTPNEKLEIDTVQKFWDLLLEVLKNIPEEGK
jgi:dipeptidase D